MYERHDPEALALHRVVRENLATFYAAIEEGWQTGLPEFVRAEFAGFLDCSVMQGGFAHLACEDFNLHAKTHTGAVDDDARARLLRYVLRPPLSQERLTVLPDHRVRLTLKRPWSDGDGRGAAACGRCGVGRP